MRKIIVAAALALASTFVVAGPAGALAPGGTVCYAVDGTPVVSSAPTPTSASRAPPVPARAGVAGVGAARCCAPSSSTRSATTTGSGSTGPYTIGGGCSAHRWPCEG